MSKLIRKWYVDQNGKTQSKGWQYPDGTLLTYKEFCNIAVTEFETFNGDYVPVKAQIRAKSPAKSLKAKVAAYKKRGIDPYYGVPKYLK